MTIIAGMVDADGSVVIGGDSLGTSGWEKTVRADPKVFRSGSYVMGFTTSYRMGQVLRYKLAPPEPPTEGDLFAFMVTEFVEHVRKALKEGGVAKLENGVESCGVFLVGVRGRLFYIDNDFQVAESADGFHACGCGREYALAAMAVAQGTAEERVTTAVSVAIRFSAGCGGPLVLARSQP